MFDDALKPSMAPLAAAAAAWGRVTIGENMKIGSNIRAFIETGSDDPHILVTLSETSLPLTGPIYAGARTYGGNKGIMITIGGVGTGGAVTVTLLQVGATKYQPPVLYTGM